VNIQRNFEGTIIVRKLGKHLPKYTVSHPKKLQNFTLVQFTNKLQTNNSFSHNFNKYKSSQSLIWPSDTKWHWKVLC